MSNAQAAQLPAVQTFNHNDVAFIAVWGRTYAFRVCSVEGSIRKHIADYGSNWETELEGLDRALERNHPIVWSMSLPCFLSDNPTHYEKNNALRAGAVEIHEDQTISIEGRLYTVKLMGKSYSDPVKFVPVKGGAA